MFKPALLRIDPREDPPVVQEVNEYIPNEKNVAVRPNRAQYRINCMNGFDHPLSIEVENYILVTVATRHVDSNAQEQSGNWSRYPTYNSAEMDFIMTVQRLPEVEWAIDNSFDGLYIHKEDDYATFMTIFKFAVYMKQEQATFWRLKFHGK